METILIIDNYKPLLKLYEKELQREGYVVVAVEGVEEALRRVQSRPFNVVIVEIGALWQDEFETLTRTLITDKKVPIIVNTAEPSPSDQPKNQNIDAWITKSSDLKPLKKIIKTLSHAA